MEDLKRLRETIDAIDGKILDLLNERALLAQQIGGIKKRNGHPVYAPERAEQLMRRLATQSKGPLAGHAIRAIYSEIMSASLALEKDTVIACEGSFTGSTHQAARQQFGSSVRYTFHTDPAALFESVATGVADCGVIPFGKEGPETAILGLLAEGKAMLCSQIVLGGEEGAVPLRYLVLGTTLNVPSGDDQTALLIHLTDQPGALASALEPFRATAVNVLSIHSRQARGGLHLFLEVEGHAGDPSLKESLDALGAAGLSTKVCGSYPRAH